MNHFSKLFALGAVAAASASAAFATPITAGGTVTATDITATPITIVTSSGVQPMMAPTFSGTYSEAVITDSSSPYASICGTSCLTFVFTFSNSGPNTVENTAMGDTTDNFSQVLTSVGYHVGAGDLGSNTPTTITETPTGTINFLFTGTPVAPGEGSAYLDIQTDATQYTTGFFTVQDSTAVNNPGYVPVASTPEPNSLVLLGTGLVGAAGMLFMRRRNAESIL